MSPSPPADRRLLVLALEPYLGGSHQAMLAGWQHYSQHTIEILGLPARHWKWRMRHAGYTLAVEARRWQAERGRHPDVIFASSMLDLPQWRGHVGGRLAECPAVVYFHENQLTHPLPGDQPTDLHYGYTNILSALAAEAVWFNSAYHRDSFLQAADQLLGRFPDYQHRPSFQQVRSRAQVRYPGVEPELLRDPATPAPTAASTPLRLGWIARWEFDKRPDCLLEVLSRLRQRSAAAERTVETSIEWTVLSKPTRRSQPLWDQLLREAAQQLSFAGYAPSRQAYVERMAGLDGVLSTAAHEFFGIAVAEAAAQGAIPIVPDRLAYPELYGGDPPAALFHDGSIDSIVAQLDTLTRLRQQPQRLAAQQQALRARVAPLSWTQQAARWDASLAQLVADADRAAP